MLSRAKPLAFNSAVVSGFIGLAVISGFAFDLLVAARFGLGRETDAYFAAVTLPVTILTAVLLSSQSVLVVALTGSVETGDTDLTALFSSLITLGALNGLLLAAAGILLSPLLMRALAPGFDAHTSNLAVSLSRILFLRVPASLAAEVCRPALLSRHRFAAASGGYLIASASGLAALLVYPGGGIRWAAWSITLSAWVGLAWVLLALLLSRSIQIRPRFGFRDPRVRQVGRDLAAPLAGLLFRQGVILAERWFGSYLGPGSVAALGYANKIVQSLAGVVFDGIATAGLPSLSRALAAGQYQVALSERRRLMGLSALIAVALGLGLALFSRPIAGFLVFRQSGISGMVTFSQVTGLLAVYSLNLIPLGPFRALQSFFYAARRPDWVGGVLILAAIVTVLLDWPFTHLLGAAGLGLSFGLGVMAALAAGFFLIRANHARLFPLAAP